MSTSGGTTGSSSSKTRQSGPETEGTKRVKSGEREEERRGSFSSLSLSLYEFENGRGATHPPIDPTLVTSPDHELNGSVAPPDGQHSPRPRTRLRLRRRRRLLRRRRVQVVGIERGRSQRERRDRTRSVVGEPTSVQRDRFPLLLLSSDRAVAVADVISRHGRIHASTRIRVECASFGIGRKRKEKK